MTKKQNQIYRMLAIYPSTKGFGYAVLEMNNQLIDYGNKVLRGDKNAKSLAHVEKMIIRNQPDALVLPDVKSKGTNRSPRIKELYEDVITLAKNRKLRVVKISGIALRIAILDNPKGTKYEISQRIAKQFLEELASRVPPKRKAWTSEASAMDIFDAVALAVALKAKIQDAHSEK